MRLKSLQNFIENTDLELFKNPQLKDLKEDYIAFMGNYYGLQGAFEALVISAENPGNSDWSMDESTRIFFVNEYKEISEVVKNILKTSSIWKYYERVNADDKWPAINRKFKLSNNLPKRFATAGTLIVSYGAFLKKLERHVQDALTQEIIDELWAIVAEEANKLIQEKQKFGDAGYQDYEKLQPLANIPEGKLSEAEDVWASLLETA